MHWIEPSHKAAPGPRYIWIFRGAFALVALGLVGTLAFAYLFTTFMPWDDEGYFLQAYRDFLSGRILYDVFQCRIIRTLRCCQRYARYLPMDTLTNLDCYCGTHGWSCVALDASPHSVSSDLLDCQSKSKGSRKVGWSPTNRGNFCGHSALVVGCCSGIPDD
jgi:hypothetical protein